jgi:hypothetical protein
MEVKLKNTITERKKKLMGWFQYQNGDDMESVNLKIEK